jgi:MFS transporter, DHA1 family, tetracycline resistance protein
MNQEPGAMPPPARKAALVYIFVTVALDMLAFGIAFPVLPRLVLEFSGGNTAKAALAYGAFGTTFAAMQFVFSPLLGALSDRFGRRPVVLLSNLGLGVDYVVMALAPSLTWLFVGRVTSGICGASYATAGAYIADVTPPEKRAASFGLLSAAFGFGFVVGPAVGGLAGRMDPRLPFWIAAVLCLLNAVYGLFVLPESLPPERRGKVHWHLANPISALLMLRREPRLLALTAVMFLHYVAHESNPSTFVLYTDYRYHWDVRTVGLSLAAVGITSTLVGVGLVRPVVARLGERRTLFAGLAFGVLGFVLCAAAPTGTLFFIAIPVLALWGLTSPAAQALLTQQADPAAQGRLQGALSGLQGIALMLGPALFTALFAAVVRPPHAAGGTGGAVAAGASAVPALSAAAHPRLAGAPYYLAALLMAIALVVALRTVRAPAAP